MTAWVLSFALTLAVELPVAAAVLRKHPRARTLGAMAAASAVTHPLFWFAWPHLFRSDWAYVGTGELGIIAVEAAILKHALGLSWRSAVAVSAFANAASYLIGLGLWGLG